MNIIDDTHRSCLLKLVGIFVAIFYFRRLNRIHSDEANRRVGRVFAVAVAVAVHRSFRLV
jgi:hypothetical protein